jgi:mRNA-degrading endonuclease YafQ of YafQ-DinJ toxin-antitoxin module
LENSLIKYFDYRSAAREAKIPKQKLRKLVELIGKEFPNDQMMAELHALRACQAIRDGHIQIDEALKLQAESQA